METLDTRKLDEISFKALNQREYGDDIDRYIYSQSGEGLGSFFGKLAKKAITILEKAIKGAVPHLQDAAIAVPHLQYAAIATGSNIIDSAIDTVPSKVGKQVLQEGKRTIQEVVNINHPLTNEKLIKDCNVEVYK